MKKAISVFTALTVTLWLSGIFMVLPVAAAFVDGDLARESDEFDVYIIKLVGDEKFKRLILNPDVFNMYGHLEWGDVQVVADGVLADYTTSELVREINDDKVYKLYPDGDVGTKKWVESLDCFTSQGFDWDSVYIINSFDRDSYTTATEALCGGAVVEGEMTLSLAVDSPEAATVPKDAHSVTFMKVKVAGTGTISQLVLKRSGAGAVGDITDVYIYENGVRLTSARSLSSATSKVTFINLDLEAPTTFDVVADLGGTAGNQDYLEILSAADVTADATVGGNFPISGNPLSLSATIIGTLTIVDSGSTSYNVTIGDVGVQISAFKVTTKYEGGDIHRIQLYNAGSINSAKLTNVKLKVLGNEVASTDAFSSDGYAVFNLDEPYNIKKGGNTIFRVYADISGGKPAEDVKLHLEVEPDIYGVGTTFGWGMSPDITGFDSDDVITVTLKGGDVTLVKVGPNAANIGTDTDDTVFLEYSMSAAADITVGRTRLFWCWDDTGSGTYNDLTATTPWFADVEDVKIINRDTGVVWAGPHDGGAFVTEADKYCPDAKDGLYKNYTDTFDLSAGESYNLQITADVKIANTAQDNLDASDIIKVGIYSYASLVTTSGTAAFMKYTGTTNAVDDTAIVPSGDIVGEQMTLQASALVISLAGSPGGTHDSWAAGTARTFVKGKTADVVGFVFTAGVASDITITDITLDGYIDIDHADPFVAGLEDTGGYIKNLISSVEIYDTATGAAIPGSSAKGFSGSSSFENVAYTGLNWVIPAGEARTMLVKANLSSTGATESAGYNMISFDIVLAATDITAQDADSNDLGALITGNAVNNAATTPFVSVVVYNYGSITAANASDTPDKGIIVMGSSDNEVSKYKLTAAREDFLIEKFTTDIDAAADGDNFTGVALKYQTEAQWGTSEWTISPKKEFVYNTVPLTFNFSGDARPYIPKDDYSYVTVLLDVDDYSGGTGADSGDYVRLHMSAADNTEFKAYGAQSGHLLTGSNVTEPGTTGLNYKYIFRSKPVFAKKAWSGDTNELARFTITADGYDVNFDGSGTEGMGAWDESVASPALEFDVIASGTEATTQTLYLYDWNNDIISSVSGGLANADITNENEVDGQESCNNASYACLTTISFRFEEADTAVVIPEGTTKKFYIMLDNSLDFNNQDEYIQLKLMQDEGAVDAVSGYDNCSIIWYDGTEDTRTQSEKGICMPAGMKGIGPLPISFRLLSGSAI